MLAIPSLDSVKKGVLGVLKAESGKLPPALMADTRGEALIDMGTRTIRLTVIPGKELNALPCWGLAARVSGMAGFFPLTRTKSGAAELFELSLGKGVTLPVDVTLALVPLVATLPVKDGYFADVTAKTALTIGEALGLSYAIDVKLTDADASDPRPLAKLRFKAHAASDSKQGGGDKR